MKSLRKRCHGRNPRSLWGRFIQFPLNLHSPSLGITGECWCKKCRKRRKIDNSKED